MTALFALGGLACGATGPSENDYTCNGYCDGEPLAQAIIQAPDPMTACTEYIESCVGSEKTCTSCD